MATSVLHEAARNGISRNRIPYEEFLKWEGDPFVEWVDGEVITMSPVTERHQSIVLFLLVMLQKFVQERVAGKVLFDPFQMKTGPELPGRAPDILFVATENLGRLHPTFLEGPADLVVEVSSPGTQGVDRGDKFYEYESGGVREYWIIDPQRKSADFYLRDADGIFRLMPLRDGNFSSQVLSGLIFTVDVLWREPLPSAFEL